MESSARSGRRCSRFADAGPTGSAAPTSRRHGQTGGTPNESMEGADRFMFYGLVLVFLLIAVGFGLALLVG